MGYSLMVTFLIEICRNLLSKIKILWYNEVEKRRIRRSKMVMKLRTLGAVYTHTPSLYEIKENKIEKYKRGLCQYVNRHKQ